MAEYAKKDLEKELDNKFGVGNWQWKTLEEQIMILAKAVYDLETDPKKWKKLKQETEEQLRKWMQEKGQLPQDQTSLGQALNDFMARAIEGDEAQAEQEKTGMFKKGKVRKRLSEAEQDIARVRRLKCIYNGNLSRMVWSGAQVPPPPTLIQRQACILSVNHVGQPHPQPQPPIPQSPPPQTQLLSYKPQLNVVQYQSTSYGGPYRGRGRGRGRGNRGGGRSPQQYDSGCFRCGAMDHWKRHCTQPPWRRAGTPHPPQPQHQATYYPAPHTGAAPGGQYQMSPWGKEH